MMNLFSLLAKLCTYAFWLGINAIHALVPDEMDVIGDAPAQHLDQLGPQESWSSWTLETFETSTGK